MIDRRLLPAAGIALGAVCAVLILTFGVSGFVFVMALAAIGGVGAGVLAANLPDDTTEAPAARRPGRWEDRR